MAAPTLRRYVLGAALLELAAFSSGMVLWLYAFAHGGAAAISWLVGIGYGVAALIAAPAGRISDRFGRCEVATVASVLRAVAVGGIVLAILDHAPLAVTIALAGLEGALYAIGGPALRSLAPSLAQDPAELNAVNVTLSTSSAVAVFVGPLLSGLLYVAAGPAPELLVCAVAFVAGTMPLFELLRRLGRTRPTAPGELIGDVSRPMPKDSVVRVAASPSIRIILTLFCGYSFAVGIVDVLLIILARGTLHIGGGGVGAIYATFGAGGVLAGFAAGRLARARLGATFGVAVVAWSVPLVCLALLPSLPLAFVAAALAGAAGTVVQSSGDTLLQRSSPDSATARVLGVYEATTGAVYVIAALLPALLLSFVGVRTLLIIGVCAGPAAVLLCLTGVRTLDKEMVRDDERLELLGKVPWLAAGGLAQQLSLADRFTDVAVQAGEIVIFQGEVGRTFSIVRAGTLRVLKDGEPVGQLRRGDSFGEIALLHDVPRQATVVATTDSALLTLDEEDFRHALSHAPEQTRRLGKAASAVAGGMVWLRREKPVAEQPPGVVDDMEERARVLRSTPLLAGVDSKVLGDMAAAARVHHHREGEALVREGDVADEAYVVWSGRLWGTRGGRDVCEVLPGQLTGELAVLHHERRGATLTTTTDTVVLAIDGDILREALRSVGGVDPVDPESG
ncbi:MAG TPA: MFS transporter [Acidimicrobiales bacterium]